MNHKKIFVFLLVLISTLFLVGCGEEVSGSDSSTELTEENELFEENTENEGFFSDVDVTEEDILTEETSMSYTYTDLNQIMYATQEVNVRDLPETEGNKIGVLSANQEINVNGQCNETGWYRIDYAGNTGYVSDNYLTAESPAEPQPENAAVQTSAEPSAPETPSAASETTPPSASTSTGSGSSVTVPSQEETVGNLVWVPTNGGTKYHSSSGCSNMIDPIQVSVETATANGYTPCKRCH